MCVKTINNCSSTILKKNIKQIMVKKTIREYERSSCAYLIKYILKDIKKIKKKKFLFFIIIDKYIIKNIDNILNVAGRYLARSIS